MKAEAAELSVRAWIGQAVATQATLLSYIDVFWCAAIFAGLMVPVVFSIKPVELGRAPAGH